MEDSRIEENRLGMKEGTWQGRGQSHKDERKERPEWHGRLTLK